MRLKAMTNVPIVSCVEEFAALRGVKANAWALTIRCYEYPVMTVSPLQPLPPDRELVVEAMTLFMRIETEVREARADWNEDRFRRLMRVRPKAVTRLRRRWNRLDPQPRLPLGRLQRRYHANIAGHLRPVSQD
jgi:hypothetical protein